MWAEIIWLKFYLVLLSLKLNSALPNDNYCLAEDSQPYLYFSTKTAYEITQQKYEADQEVLPRDIKDIPDCTPVGIWILLRHGARYPHQQQIKKFRELTNIRDAVIANHFDRKTGGLCGEDVDALRGWTFNLTDDDADILTWQGKIDEIYIARRLKNHFRELLDATYTDTRFDVRTTERERTKSSAAAFMEELQGSSFDLSDNFIDPLLSPEINCTGWHKSITSEEANREAELFKESNYMKETLHEVSKRLGFGYDLTFDAVYDIYSICSFDKAWYYKSVSPWCAAFTPYHLKVLEYYEDLYYYYRSGYGNPNAARLGCHLVQDLIYKFDNMTNRNGTIDVPPISLFFTHSVMLRAVLTRLGIAKDIMPPTHINFNPSTTTRRQWRTSIISPFAGNLAVVLYRCQNSKYKVMFYLNEQIIDYAGCKVGLCDWSYIYNSFAELVNPSICNLDFCYQTGSSIKITFTLWTFILTAYTVLL